MVWRFFPIGDPTVDIFMVRDIDSAVVTRGASAVKQWLESDKIFHTMRDHPDHNAWVMGGLWGAKNTALDNTTRHNILRYFSEVTFYFHFIVNAYNVKVQGEINHKATFYYRENFHLKLKMIKMS